MERNVYLFIIIILLALGSTLGATGEAWAFSGFELGVSDTREYKELVFLGGTPTVFKGTLKETTKSRDDTVQTSLTYKLEEVAGKGKLTRSVKFTSQVEKRGNQEVHVTRVDSYTESVDIGGLKLKLKTDGVFLNSSQVIDHQPAVDFITRNWYIKKVYEAGRGQGGITVEMSGSAEGYGNAWGRGETGTVQISLSGELTSSNGNQAPVTTRWQGSARVVMNDTSSRSLVYVPTGPELISFTGGFVDETRREQVLTATYDLPAASNGGLDNSVRNHGEYSMSATSPPGIKRLFVREFRDLRGHWARREIESLCGLGAFDLQGDFFQPGLPVRRGEFIKALVVVAGLTPQEETSAPARNQRGKAPAEEALFYDVDTSSPYYTYVQVAGKKGLVEGSGKVFRPNANLTRAEAVTILVKAMGLENLAPTPAYSTGFYDDHQIPLWARDAVYVAQSYGLIRGDFVGGTKMFRPQDAVTRAEAAAMLDKFRDYLNRDFRKDYRDRLYGFAN